MHVLAIDQGTTGTTCLIVNERHEVVARAYRESLAELSTTGLGRA